LTSRISNRPSEAGGVEKVLKAGQDLAAGSSAVPSAKQLKHIGLAMQEYYDVGKKLPPAYQPDENGKPLLCLRGLILPHLGQDALYRGFHLAEPRDSQHIGKADSRLRGA
jgi:hypothetical protein